MQCMLGAQRADLDAMKLARFLRRVEDGYVQNPYHNRTHAADVLQSQYMLLTAGGLGSRAADPLVLLAGLLSAAIHDLDHKGVNNDFLIRQSDELAITYNGASHALLAPCSSCSLVPRLCTHGHRQTCASLCVGQGRVGRSSRVNVLPLSLVLRVVD